jgi:hypothetical protein
MYPGYYGFNGLSMIGLKRGKSSYITDRTAKTGVDVSESVNIFYAVSPDTKCFAINSQETLIEMFDLSGEDGVFRSSLELFQNTSVIPTFNVSMSIAIKTIRYI